MKNMAESPQYESLILLHSNDMHGDFFHEELHEEEVGGLSMLSGYINHVRKTNENVVYAIAGDMLQGSIIDQEYKGVSTIDLMNMLHPDIVTLGNHEIDYGLAHLLFLEKVAKFPIINGNLIIKNTNQKLFESHKIMQIGNLNILFIGIITNDIVNLNSQDPLLSSFVDVAEAAREIEKICNTNKTVDIDLTVILTHIGLDADKKLAMEINPDLGVDIIIGGHSHTTMEQPENVNNILIVQAASGTNQVGRFDIVVDKNQDNIYKWDWNLVPIKDKNLQDEAMNETLSGYKEQVDAKYGQVITRMKNGLDHTDRFKETVLGNVVSDVLMNMFNLDLFLMGSGAIRGSLGEVVTRGKLREIFPFDESIYCLWITGTQMEELLYNVVTRYVQGITNEFYQYSKGTKILYQKEGSIMKELLIQGQPIDREKIYSIAMTKFHFANLDKFMGMNVDELQRVRRAKIISTSFYDSIEDFFEETSDITGALENRIQII